MKVINLISGPRNISTALMYAFAQRQDCSVVDEPFYAYYLRYASNRTIHPGENEVLASMPASFDEVLRLIEEEAHNEHVFIKGMAHHYLMDSPDFILDWTNVFLVRKPSSLITSFSRVIQNPGIADIGYKDTIRLINYLQKAGKDILVLDSDELLKDPESYLRQLCAKLQLPFDGKMLRWPKGGIPEDGIWAKYWYAAVHASTGFEQRSAANYQVPVSLEGLLRESTVYYRQIQPYILKNKSHAANL